jgi:CHAT domain-containing protein
VEVRLLAPDGRLLRRVDSVRGDGAYGPEPLPLVAAEPGDYALEIRAGAPGDPKGSYAVLVEGLRPPSAADRALVAAEEAFAAAEALRRQGGTPARRRALAGQRRALSLLRSIGRKERQADVLFSLGETHSRLGEYGQARRPYAEALDLLRAAGQERQVPQTLLGLGRAHANAGEPAAARDWYREALALGRRLGAPRDEATALHNLGTLAGSLGDAMEAIDLLEAALALWRRLGDPAEEATVLNQLGQQYLGLGEIRVGSDHFEEARALLATAGEGRRSGSVLHSLGVARVLLGDLPAGLGLLEEALLLHRREGNRRDEAVVLNDLGWAHQQRGDSAAARRRYEEALALFRALGSVRDEATTRQNLAWADEARGDPEAAERLYRLALQGFRRLGDRGGEANTLYGLARAQRRRGDLAGCRASLEAALAGIEALRARPVPHALRASYFASKQQVYGFYIDLLMDLNRRQPGGGHHLRALEASEQARARGFLDALAEAAGPPEQGADRRRAAEETELAARLERQELRRMELLLADAPRQQIEAAERELRRLLLRHRRARALLPAPLAVSRGEPLSAVEIRRLLDGDTLLLEYFLGEERSFLWAVTAAEVAAFELAGRPVIESAARLACELLPASHRSTARARAEMALADLGRLLLAPVADRLAGKRLVVVGDGVLHSIPFAALPAPRAAGASYVPLAAEHEIVSLPSASVAAALRRGRREGSGGRTAVAVFADPVFGADDPRVARAQEAAGPAAGAAASSGHRPAAPAPGPPRGGYRRLPFSRQEAQAILDLVPAGASLAALDFAASREAVTAGALGRFRVIHFATHAVLDTAYPELSGLVLSLVDRQGRPRNGFLRAHEISGLDLAADLVVLSACRTALGKEIRGEGLVGLPRAFLDAGGRRVLVSLWQVEDRATAELMRGFYRGMLEQGLPPEAALRRAQLALWRETDWRAPYFWAGFVLQGDWQEGGLR